MPVMYVKFYVGLETLWILEQKNEKMAKNWENLTFQKSNKCVFLLNGKIKINSETSFDHPTFN